MTVSNSTREYGLIAISVALITILLFMLDKDTASFFDLLKPENLLAFIIYCIPTALVSLLMYHVFLKKFSETKSTILGLLTGVPLCWAIIILLFYIKLNS